MAEQDPTLRTIYQDAERGRHSLDSFSSITSAFQEKLLATIHSYEQCLAIVEQIHLFSPNETLEDIASADLPFLVLNFRLAALCMRTSHRDRKAVLLRSQQHYTTFLQQLDSYDVLSKDDSRLFEQYRGSPQTFSTAPNDPAKRREQKIKRFKEEKSLKQRLEQYENDSIALESDDDAYRQAQLTNLAYCTYQSFESLESIAQELHILSLRPPTPPPDMHGQEDVRERRSGHDGYDERLDTGPRSAGLKGPLLDSQGKPLRPFTLFGSKREELRAGVFRPDHSLPTMSIDEYLEEERKRGGIIEGGGPQSGIKPEVDEDDMEAADRATMKAREWDEYVEANPRGSGNTLNRG